MICLLVLKPKFKEDGYIDHFYKLGNQNHVNSHRGDRRA
jgi:hypothetical protein